MSNEDYSEHGIAIVYDEIEVSEQGKGLGTVVGRLVKKYGTLNAAALSNNLANFCRQMGLIFRDVSTSIENYDLETIELNTEITAAGEIRMIGGVSGEMTGGVKLIFKSRAFSGQPR